MLMRHLRLLPALTSALLLLTGAGQSALRFTDVTAKSGVAFRHQNGAAGQKYYPEAFGSGVCVVDYDRDGWPDLYFVNGRNWTADETRRSKMRAREPAPRSAGPAYPALFRNRHDGTFQDATREAGLQVESYGMGCAVGDYDNDGAPDLVLTGYGGTRLFHHDGKSRFEDVTAGVGLRDAGWSTCALWFDYDGDGDLDLLVCHYVQWTPATDITCGLSGNVKLFCGPDPYRGESNRLYRNDLVDGKRTFTDVTQTAGLLNPKGKTLGAALFDYDHDGRPDLVIANDQVPNFLYRNNGDGTFTDESVILGTSVGRFGVARAGMGIDAADPFNDGSISIVVGNFAKEGLTFHRLERRPAPAVPSPGTEPLSPLSPAAVFKDQAPRVGLTAPSLPFLTFGVAFFDADLDGRLDIVTANGHIDADLVNFLERSVTYRERPLLFLAGADKGPTYEEIGTPAGLSSALVGRGIVYLDYDRDGDLDLVFTENGGPAHLYRNEGVPSHHWLRLELRGAASNRDAIGAVVTVAANGMTQSRMVKTGSSYLSQSELTLTLGLGNAETADRIEIQWPSGRIQVLEKVAADQQLVITEP